MRKFLKSIWVLQEVPNEKRRPRLGRGYSTAVRLNPYNPLSYITVILSVIIGLIMFGIIGFWNEVDLKNPFKWD